MTAPSAQIKLLPCPFCGGEAGTLHHVDSKTWRIWCLRPTQKCGAVMVGATKEEVENTWNRRHGWQPIETAQLGKMVMLKGGGWRHEWAGQVIDLDTGKCILDSPTPEHPTTPHFATHWKEIEAPPTNPRG